MEKSSNRRNRDEKGGGVSTLLGFVWPLLYESDNVSYSVSYVDRERSRGHLVGCGSLVGTLFNIALSQRSIQKGGTAMSFIGRYFDRQWKKHEPRKELLYSRPRGEIGFLCVRCFIVEQKETPVFGGQSWCAECRRKEQQYQTLVDSCQKKCRHKWLCRRDGFEQKFYHRCTRGGKKYYGRDWLVLRVLNKINFEFSSCLFFMVVVGIAASVWTRTWVSLPLIVMCFTMGLVFKATFERGCF